MIAIVFAASVAVAAPLLAAPAGGAPRATPRSAPDAGLCGPVGTNTPDAFGANSNNVGVVDLHWYYGYGAQVSFFECVGERPVPLGAVTQSATPVTSLNAAVPWLCGRRVRRFAATSTPPGGAPLRGIATVRTVSCAHRFTLSAPASVGRGRRVKVTITDGWGTGAITPRLCVRSPQGVRHCHAVPFAAAMQARSQAFRPDERGDWRLDLEVAGFHVRGTVAVGVRPPASKPRPVVLATGDSTMQGVESSLSDGLGEFDVRSKVLPGYEMSNSDWPGFAVTQTRQLHPAVTVISIGGVEGFAFKLADGSQVACCGPAWVAEYARRARRMLRTYARHGRARVFYLTIALPKDPTRAAITTAANAAMVQAGRGLPGVTVLRMDLLFTPHGYQETIRDGGRDVDVREFDGVHLSASGTSIEAREVIKAIRGQPTLVPPSPASVRASR